MTATPHHHWGLILLDDDAPDELVPTATSTAATPSPATVPPVREEPVSPAPKVPVVPDRLEAFTADALVWARALQFKADELRRRQLTFGYVVVAITATTSLGVLSQTNANPPPWATLAAAVATAIASVLAAIQTYGNFATRAQTMLDQSASFGELHGKMLADCEAIVQGKSSPDDPAVEALYDDYVKLRGTRTFVEPKLYERAQEAVIKQADVQKSLAAMRDR